MMYIRQGCSGTNSMQSTLLTRQLQYKKKFTTIVAPTSSRVAVVQVAFSALSCWGCFRTRSSLACGRRISFRYWLGTAVSSIRNFPRISRLRSCSRKRLLRKQKEAQKSQIGIVPPFMLSLPPPIS